MEVSKAPNIDGGRPPHHTPPHHTPHSGKVIPTSSAPLANHRERSEPPRISHNSPVRPQILPNHASTIFQARPMQQPPTLIQAPTMTDIRSSPHSSVYVHARAQTPAGQHASLHHVAARQSPRQPLVMTSHHHPGFLSGVAEKSLSPAGLPRSASAEEARKRALKGKCDPPRILDHQHPLHPHVVGGYPAMAGLAHHGGHPGAHLSQRGATLHYSSKLPPAVMSVAPLVLEKTKGEDVKADVNAEKVRTLAGLDRERAALSRESSVVDVERVGPEIGGRNIRGVTTGAIYHERSVHPDLAVITPRGDQLPWDTNKGGGGGWDVYRCGGCGTTFRDKVQLEKHACVSATEGSKPYQCGRCQLSFTEPKHLQEHMALHIADRPFKCGVCARSFSGAATLASHMQVHRGGGGQEKTSTGETVVVSQHPPPGLLDCEKCGKRFLQSEDLVKHVTTPGVCVT